MNIDRIHRYVVILLIATAFGPAANQVSAQSVDELQRGFIHPPDDARIMMRWWWFGPAVTKPEIERELQAMKAGGIGGFEVQPVYPLSLDDPARGIKNFSFLSDEYIDALKFTAEKARELGLRMDLTLGSGWPFGGPSVTPDQAAGALRVERVKVGNSSRIPLPPIGAGEKLIGIFLVTGSGSTAEYKNIFAPSDIKDGAVYLLDSVSAGTEVQFYISSRGGMQVKRPAIGGEGFVLDHLNREATDAYLHNVGDRLMKAFGAKPPFAIFCDSLEVYNQDWTGDYLEEFQRRRGYDLRPYLPALANDLPESPDIRYDWGRTLTELLNERFLAPMQQWSKRNNTRFRIQNYGIPPATISSSYYADLPEGEGAQWKVVRASRWASSASHLYNRPVTSSETWTWLHSPVFRATPLDMKAEADIHFLQGINQLIGHGWPYTPPGVDYPGWRFYAAAALDEKNPWWPVMPDLSVYLQRVSYVMRQGRPANDVAVYLPNADAYSHFTPGKVHMIDAERELVGTDLIPTILGSGYNLDFFDDESLQQVGKVDNGALVLGGNPYRVVILPGIERTPLATMQRLAEFVQSGGVLIATRRLPDAAPGMRDRATGTEQLRRIVNELFKPPNARAQLVVDEKTELAKALKSSLTSDMAMLNPAPETGFIHRATPDADFYFIANTSGKRQQNTLTFRVKGGNAEWWDPMTGDISPGDYFWSEADGRRSTNIDLEPYGSRVVVIRREPTREPPAGEDTGTLGTSVNLSENWQVRFGDGTVPRLMKTLHSWTDDEETRFFSGTAVYERTVNVPAEWSSATFTLEFGEGKSLDPQTLRNGTQTWFEPPIRDAAIVYVNGVRAGSLWAPPYRLALPKLALGENRIRIEVSNTAVNAMAGRALPDYRLLNLRFGERFQPQDMDKVQPVTSGLFGPITLEVRGVSIDIKKMLELPLQPRTPLVLQPSKPSN
jgi:hypothetical protein